MIQPLLKRDVMKQSISFCTLLMLLWLAVSCSKTSEDQLATETPATCDTLNSKYAADVVPILQGNCYGCHGNGASAGGVTLDTYQNVKLRADNGILLGVITHSPGYSPMPQDAPKLSDCDINTIRSWINNGAQNN